MVLSNRASFAWHQPRLWQYGKRNENFYRCPVSLVKNPSRGAYTAYFLLLDYNATNSWDSLSLNWLAEILNPSERR